MHVLSNSTLLAALITVGLLVSAASVSGKQAPREPLFPLSGDSRYDVAHYDAHLTYMLASGRLRQRRRSKQRR